MKLETRLLLRALARRSAPAQQINEDIQSTVSPSTGAGEHVLGHLFDKQKAFVRDPASKKAGRCSRRAGKTAAAGASMVRNCLNRAGGLCAYITITRSQAKRLMWPELKRINRHYDLGMTFNNTELVAHFPNGSQIWLAGADKADRIEQFRGVAFLEVILDESASFKRHLEALIEEVIGPTLEDYGGAVTMIGTPGKQLVGLFFSATRPDSKRDTTWSLHSWTVLENPMFPRWRGKRQWRSSAQRWLEDLRAKNNWATDNPVYLREWMARWVRDMGTLVYNFDPDRNLYTKLPDDQDWRYILGVDLGHDDATAFVVLAFTRDLPTVYVVHTEKERGLIVSEVAARVKKLRSKFKFTKMIIDTGGLGKMIAQELRKRHALPFIPAEKRDKLAFIELMNSDLRNGRVLVLEDSPLVGEWELLQKDEDGEEDDRFDNHLCDGALYAWRECRHYVYRPSAERPEEGSPEYWDLIDEELLEEAINDHEEHDEVDTLWN